MMTDPRISEMRPIYNYVDATNTDPLGGIPEWVFKHVHDKSDYYWWVQNWLYNENSNHEVSTCVPPYDDFSENSACFDTVKYFLKDEFAPAILQCHIGLLPFYCPYKYKAADVKGILYSGYKQDAAIDKEKWNLTNHVTSSMTNYTIRYEIPVVDVSVMSNYTASNGSTSGSNSTNSTGT